MLKVIAAARVSVALALMMGGAGAAAAQSLPLPTVPNQDVEIWFGPQTWDISPTSGTLIYSVGDFPALIAPDAPWQTAKSRISTLHLPGDVVWSYPALASLVAFVVRNAGIKINFGEGVLFNGGQCGVGVEGMSTDPDYNHEAVTIAKIWQQAGGRLDYLVMDAPLYYGHAYAGGCNYSIQEVATRAAATVNLVRQYFPNVKIVDADGPGTESNANWFADMQQFMTDFKSATGQPFYAVTLDLHWHDLRPHQTLAATVRSSVSFFHGLGVRTGLFIDADQTTANMASDAAWMAQYRQHLRQTANAGYGLDYIAIESWINLPKDNLPETTPTAFTSLVDYAFKLFKG